jgi:hypothetical protein
MFNGIWVPEALLGCSDISASAKLLYGRLARFAGEGGRCFPSVERLAAELGMTDRQVQRLIGQLCSAGFLRKDSQYRADGSQTSNAYFFLYHRSLVPSPVLQPKNPGPTRTKNSPGKPRGDKNVTGDKQVRRGVTPASPLEESQLNSNRLQSSSSTDSTAQTHAAAELKLDQYPLSVIRFREFFPRTTDTVLMRILRAILAINPGVRDDDVAAAVYIRRDQASPGLWALTMPERVREHLRRENFCSKGLRKGSYVPSHREDPQCKWAEAKTKLRDILSPEGFENWLQCTYQVAKDGEILRIAVPDVETKNWLESEYCSAIAAVALPLKVEYEVIDRAQLFHTLFGRIASIQSSIPGCQTDPVVSLEREADIDAVCQILDELVGVDVESFCDDAASQFENCEELEELPGRARTLDLLRDWAKTWAAQQRHARVGGLGPRIPINLAGKGPRSSRIEAEVGQHG